MNKWKDAVFKHVEEVACECTGAITKPVTTENLYKGVTKTPLNVSLARSLAMMVLHDIYAMTYREIAARAGMTIRAVMRLTANAREFVFSDEIFNKTYHLIIQKL